MADLASPACNFETRKTAPGLNLVDCRQVGDDWWRLESQNNGLIKDNHITFAGGITNALKSVDLNLQMEVEVETRTIEDIEKVLEYASQTKTSLTQIMLDNMVVPLPNGDVDVSMLKQAVKLIDRRFKTEASGNVTLETVHKIGQTRVDFISRFWFCAGNKIGTKRLPRPIHFKRLPEVTIRGGFLSSLCLLFPSTNEIIVEDGRQSQDSTSKPKHG